MLRGEAMLGTSIMTVAALLAAAGLVSAYGPKDRKDRDLWTAQGGQPFSVKLGDRWVSYVNIGAIAIPIALAASISEAIKDGMDEDTAEQMVLTGVGQMVSRSSQFLLNVTALKGITDFVRAVSEPDRYAENFVENFVASWTPYGGLLANVARAIDSEIKDPKTVGDALMARIPFVSMYGVPPLGIAPPPTARTQLGEPRTRGTTGFLSFTPIRAAQEKLTPLLQEIQRLRTANQDVDVGWVGTTIEGIKLTNREQDEYQRVGGQAAKAALEPLVASAAYKSASDREKARLIETEVSQARQEARYELLPSIATRFGQSDDDVYRLADVALKVLMETGTYKSAKTDIERGKMIESVLERIQSNITEQTKAIIQGRKPRDLWTADDMPKLAKAIEVYYQHKAIPLYRGIKQEQLADVAKAIRIVGAYSAKLPAGTKKKSTIAFGQAWRDYPEMRASLRYVPYISKLRNPERQLFWQRNKTLLDKYFGSNELVRTAA